VKRKSTSVTEGLASNDRRRARDFFELRSGGIGPHARTTPLTRTYCCRSAKIICSKIQDGWITSTFEWQRGAQYYGYDPKKNRYVTLGISGPGNYGAGYINGTGKTVSFQLPDAIDSDTYTPGDYGTVTQTANGYNGKQSGPIRQVSRSAFHVDV